MRPGGGGGWKIDSLARFGGIAMQRGGYLAAVGAAVAAGVLGLASLNGGREEAVAVPPLSLEGYLDEKLPEAPEEEDVVKVDNFSCYVCHANYQTEELARVHARAGVGCGDCHGPSYAHRDDEAHIIPPDIMFAPEEIDNQCIKCHKTHDAPATAVLARYLERVPGKTQAEKVVCTDCHGEHRLRLRTVWWDRRTREMIVRDDGQPFKVRPDWSRPPGAESPPDGSR